MMQEIRHALRMIARSPGFTSIAVLSLALGIGANAAIFSLADALLFRPLPAAHPGSVMAVNLDTPSGDPGSFSYPDYRDLRAASKSFDGIAAFQLATFSLARSKDEVPQMRAGMEVSDNFFSVLGIAPALGRSFLPEETVKGGAPAVVLGYGFWQDQFSGDPGVLGRTIRISGTDFSIVGVAPKTFTGMDQYFRPSFMIPAALAQQLTGAPKDPMENRGDYNFTLEGRLKQGVSIRQAQAEMSTLWKGLQQQYPADGRNGKMAVRTQLQYRIAQDSIDAILITMLMVLVSVVLLIACANVANLLLGRARGRTREIAVRIALGVGRTRLLRQLFIENILLSLAGGLAGLGFAYGGIRFLQTIKVPTDLPVVISPELDQRVLVFSLIAALFSVLVFGLAPAFQSLKTDVVSALKSSETNMSGRRRTLGRNALVIAQIALSMVLLVASGMLLDGFRKSLVASPGFRTDHLMMTEFDTSLVRYAPEKTRAFYRDLVERARELPGVRSATLTATVPFSPTQSGREVIPEGYQAPKGQEGISLLFDVVDESYFGTMKIPLVSGRAFTVNDKSDAPPVAIVNQEFAARVWPGQDPLGKRFRLDNKKGKLVQVVGVARNSKYGFISEPQLRYFYLPYAQEGGTRMVLLTESSGDPALLAAPLRQIVRSMDPNQPMYNVRTFADFYEMRAIDAPLMITQMVVTMGLIGLVLALIGIYGLVSYSVARRTREIGVRIAIGASRTDVIRMVLRQGLALAGIGIGVGGALSVVAGKALAAGMIGLGKPNPATFIVVPLAVLLVTMAACWAPAWRASRVDPLRALRAD
ncbi:MAG TPA: ABC transporter permease [Candidatus Angelobacter sp.]|nr:ABC transporter permease [Candidatus Angelobacter sp.]